MKTIRKPIHAGYGDVDAAQTAPCRGCRSSTVTAMLVCSKISRLSAENLQPLCPVLAIQVGGLLLLYVFSTYMYLPRSLVTYLSGYPNMILLVRYPSLQVIVVLRERTGRSVQTVTQISAFLDMFLPPASCRVLLFLSLVYKCFRIYLSLAAFVLMLSRVQPGARQLSWRGIASKLQNGFVKTEAFSYPWHNSCSLVSPTSRAVPPWQQRRG